MTRNAAETDKTGPETRAQPVQALADAEASECRAGSQKTEGGPNPERPAESRTEPRTASDILRMIVHGRHCGCDLCTTEEIK